MNMRDQYVPPHHVLPAAAIATLQRAARTENTAADPLARQKAIEKATQRVKEQFPEYFKE